MTLTLRRSFLLILFFIAVAASVLCVLAWAGLHTGMYARDYETPAKSLKWWTMTRPAVQQDLVWTMMGITFLSVFPVFAETIMRKRFGGSPSPEMFFIRLFVLTLPFQAIRLGIPLLSADFPAMVWGTSFTRISFFGHFLGVCCILMAGIFSIDMLFRRSGPVLSAAIAAATGISVMLPLDVTQPLGNLLFRMGTEDAPALVLTSMEGLAVLAMLGNAVLKRNERYYVLTLALGLMAIGNEFTYFTAGASLIPGVVCLTGGLIVFSRQIRKIYQWI